VLPTLGDEHFFAEFYAVHHNYPSLGYYGTGAGSRKTGRTDFRLEDTAVDATVGYRPARHFAIGSSVGYLLNNIGPGTDDRYASSERVYSAAQAPGIDVQSNFLRTGAFAQYDWRDNPDGPRRGGNYFAQFSDYRDRTLGLSDFRRLDMEAQQYVSVLNQKRVFAVRAKSVLTFRDGNRAIPFYMQPSLGGSEDLRGYRPFRFRDDNLFVMNGEYRWEVFSGLDMALFADAGKVFARRSQFDLSHLESDAGFGFRFNARNKTFLRIDVGFSHEGFQVWVKFNNLFKRGPVHSSSSMGDL
jgi:outer membrane protein assembly factor BamA